MVEESGRPIQIQRYSAQEMLFNSLNFLLFFIIVYSAYRVLPHRGQNYLLLIASYYFYACWDWRFLGLIWLSTLVDFLCGLKIHNAVSQSQRRLFLTISVGVNLGVLAFFKYFNFFMENLQALATSAGWQLDDVTLNIILPMGISFYTFQTMSYTIDIYRKRLEPTRHFGDFALFVAFFPQLVAGPIERAARLLPQVAKERVITRKQLSDGLWLVFFGFFLKVFVADNLAEVANAAFDPSAQVSGDVALMGVYAFAFQIFGDFAGYSGIAIGLSKLMGFELMTNFRFPYLVTNPSDFWKHWHISLSSWLRDYLYIPLGGSRGGNFSLYRNLILTMLLGGLWHGAAWTFVIWGAYQGGILIVHRMLKPHLDKITFSGLGGSAWWLLRVIFMFQVICVGWLFFRAQSVEQIGLMLSSILSMSSISSVAIFYAMQIVFFTWVLLLLQIMQIRRDDLLATQKLSAGRKAVLFAGMFFLMATWGEYGGQEFIYFQF